MPDLSDKLGDFKLAVEDLRVATSTGQIYSAKESQIYAGPPRFSMFNSATKLYPIASVDVVRIDQQAAINSSAGVGSPLITWNGRPSVAAGFGRTLFNIPSLIRSLYAYYPHSTTGQDIADLTAYEMSSFKAGTNETVTFPELDTMNAETSPGYRNLSLNLSSDLQNYPFGLLIIFQTQNLDVENIVGYFLSESRIRAHSVQIAGPSTLISEEVSVVATAFHSVAM
jgi:hypothetical protein